MTDLKTPLARSFPANLRLVSRAAGRADLVHVNRAYPYTAALVTAARRSARRLVVDMEDWDGLGGYTSYARRYGPAGLLLTAFEDTFPRSADEVLVVSRLLRSHMRAIGVQADRISFIPNGFDPELFRPEAAPSSARNPYRPEGFPVLVYAGSYWPFELDLHRRLLEAFREVLKSLPEARLLVAGRGDRPVREMATTLGVGKSVSFAGFVPRVSLPTLIAAADIAVHIISDHAFHRASSPMIVPEYMAMGKPVVAPAVGELEVMLGGGAGVLVREPDPASMASAVVNLAGDGRFMKSVGERAARAARGYSYDVLARQLSQIYATA